MSALSYKLKVTHSSLQCEINGTIYRPSEALSIGVLPSKHNVIECMMYLLRPGVPGPQISVHEAANVLARNLTRHWGFANIYTLACIIRAFESCLFFKVFSAAVALMGIHLIQPYLQITYYDALNYAELIPVMRKLYVNLSTTPAEKLTDLSRPALSFVDEVQFKKSLYHADMLVSLTECVTAHKEDVVNVVQLMLTACAKGFEKQRGDYFAFWKL